MQQELTTLQPKLIQTSAETDMMVKIEKETEEVDAKKELVSADEEVANEAAAAAQAIKVCSTYVVCQVGGSKIFFPLKTIFIFFFNEVKNHTLKPYNTTIQSQ